ncbi:hypothetical protein B566_EDAN001778 [Ephemera danica]|nr:hypothetical protein B566_EDAN001778 [Ephemera danica]
MMSNMSSPTKQHSNDREHFEPNFNGGIHQKKKGTLSGGMFNEINQINNMHWISPMDLHVHESFDMRVPDRILVAGQNKHIGTNAPPRELQLENAMMPPDPGFVRIQTPPRVISLDRYTIPTATDEFSDNEELPDYKPLPPVIATRNGPMVLDGSGDFNKSTLNMSMRESTPPGDMSLSQLNLSPAEEVMMLRRQVIKLNRRVFAIENEVVQQQQREKVLLAIGLAYFLVKSVIWLARSPS